MLQNVWKMLPKYMELLPSNLRHASLEGHLKILSRFLLIIAATLLLLPSVCTAEPLMDRIKSLEPIIGGHPPNIRSEEELNAVKNRYIEIKSELDALLVARPKDQELLFMRGYLQSMGHNFDYPGAWQGSTDDLKALLNDNPAHIPAILELARLWVNSNPELAPNAEKLFRSAQCYNENEPLEEAQRGIFFALYYQGKIKEALRQSEYLKQTWPQNEQYQRFNEMTRAVLARSNAAGDTKEHVPTNLAMATCNQ